MPKNKLEDLRNHLFEVIELLKDGDIEVEKADAINNVAKTLVESAKVEATVLKITKTKQTDFFDNSNRELPELVEGNTNGKFLPRKHEDV